MKKLVEIEKQFQNCRELRKVEYDVPELDYTDVSLLKCPGGKYAVYMIMRTYEGDIVDYETNLYDNLRDAIEEYKSQVELIITDIHLLLADAEDGVIELDEFAKRRLKEQLDVMRRELSEVGKLASNPINES